LDNLLFIISERIWKNELFKAMLEHFSNLHVFCTVYGATHNFKRGGRKEGEERRGEELRGVETLEPDQVDKHTNLVFAIKLRPKICTHPLLHR
jgi:hypothetical protein